MSIEAFSLNSLLGLKENMSKEDFKNLKGLVESYNERKKASDTKSVKFIVCTPSEFYMEVHPSLSSVNFKDMKQQDISAEYKDCYVYLVIINDSPLYKKLNENSYDEILNISISQ